MPSDLTTLSGVEVGYEDLPGWQSDISGARSWNDLPENAQKYIRCPLPPELRPRPSPDLPPCPCPRMPAIIRSVRYLRTVWWAMLNASQGSAHPTPFNCMQKQHVTPTRTTSAGKSSRVDPNSVMSCGICYLELSVLSAASTQGRPYCHT